MIEVNKVLKLSATMLQLKDIENILSSSSQLSEVGNDDLELLLSCLNLVCEQIASDYIHLISKKNVVTTNGFIPWSAFDGIQLYKIVKVKDSKGESLNFKIVADGIVCNSDNVQVVYSYFPQEYNFNEFISDFNCSVDERILALGVCFEYLFIKGNSTDAQIWESRFTNAMKNIVAKRKEVVLPKRRWW